MNLPFDALAVSLPFDTSAVNLPFDILAVNVPFDAIADTLLAQFINLDRLRVQNHVGCGQQCFHLD